MSVVDISQVSHTPRTASLPSTDTISPSSPTSGSSDSQAHRVTFYISPVLTINPSTPTSSHSFSFSTDRQPLAIISDPSNISDADQELIFDTKTAYDAILTRYMEDWDITDGQYSTKDDAREFSQLERAVFEICTGKVTCSIAEAEMSVMYAGLARRMQLMQDEIKSVLAYKDFDVNVVDTRTKRGLLSMEGERGRARERAERSAYSTYAPGPGLGG